MRYRIATATSTRVLPTLDGPMAIQEGETVIVAVVKDYEGVERLMRWLANDEARRGDGK